MALVEKSKRVKANEKGNFVYVTIYSKYYDTKNNKIVSKVTAKRHKRSYWYFGLEYVI